MPKATVAIEDRRFYQHDGIDVEGIARALWKNVSAGQVVEGGSTITQQLVRNLYIGREKTVERKLKEACLAIKLDKAWAKDRILATYMNQVYYGNLAYGIEAAAQTYFSKHASELNLPEAAMLAGLPQAPCDYNPFQKESREERRNQVLQALLNEGDITQEQYDWAVRRGLGLKAGKLYKEIREPVLLRLCARPADRRVRRRHRPLGRPQGLHDDRPALPAGRPEGDQGDAVRARRPGCRRDLDQPEERRDPGDDGRDPRATRRTSSTCSRRRGASRARPSRRSSSPRPSSRGSTRRRRRISPRRSSTGPIRTGTARTAPGGARRPTTTATPAGRRSSGPRSARTTPSTRS